MDFQSLTRRELQTLCKKNKIPANMTNVGMADALKALQNVEGLEEFLNPSESQNPQSPEKPEIGSPEIPQTVCRTSTRRRPIKAAEEPESSQTLTRTRCRTRRIKEKVNQENSEVPQTPAVPSSRKKAPATSRQKTVIQAEQSSAQRVYSTRRSARLSEKLSRTEPMEVEFSKVMTKELDGDEEENKGAVLQTISEDNSKITDDSEVVSDKKSVLNDNDSKAEVKENNGESAKPDNSDFLEVSEEKDEAHVEQENTAEAELQKNSEVDCEQKDESDKLLSEILKTSVHWNDESIVKKGTVIMLNTKILNEGSKLDNEQQPRESDLELDLTAPPQASIDDSSCDSETPELSLSAFADEVACQNPVSMDSEMNVASEGEPDDDDDDGKAADQGDSEECNMDLNQKAGDAFSRESGSDCSVVANQSEAQVELEFAKQGGMNFEDVSPPPPSTDNDPMPETREPNSEACVNVNEINNSVETLPNGDEMSVVFHELITAEENAIAVGEFSPLLDIFPTPVKLISPHHRPVFNTAISGRTLLSMDSEMNVASEGEPDGGDDGKAVDQRDCEEFNMDLNLKAVDAFSSEYGSDCSVVVDQSEPQVEPEFAKQGSMDFEDVLPPFSGYDPMPETREPNSEVCVNVDETNNFVESLPQGDEMSVVFHELMITAEEHAMAVHKFPSLLDNFPTPVKLTSPHRPVSNTAVSGRTPLSPLAASPCLGQASLPTLSTPTRKSSSKKPSATQKVTLLSDNKENLDNSGRKMVLKIETGKKKNSRDTAEDIMLKKLSDTSLRQLRKMFKEKLQIKENTNKNNEDMNDVEEVAKMRPALQTLPENRKAVVETGKEN